MSDAINLIKGSKAKRLQQEKLLRIFRIVSFASFGLVVVSSMVFFLLNTRSLVDSLKQQENTELSHVMVSQKKVGKLLFTENRVKNIADILEKRTTFDDAIKNITDIIPSGISIDSFNLDKKNFSLTITSSSLYSINILLEGLEQLSDNKKVFASIMLDGLSLDAKGGGYIISVSGIFP